ncbi:hypothetical protein E5F05_01880 (plasmid) [Deinococcus metallilatus]|uniref:HNH/endonuclease VII fold putative polymorphic toxin n=1 Tax=Deinococcus metallilatus TaxID=1211322 RepID=UPI0010C58BD7|nr:hypothetical protein E5F05_01880 [Deinococcus metallilatus]GMA14374.1 hypothetical protein GCM10025871_07050 [Deinococcus metallilatus]
MFNLTVSEAHTYYVGQDGWLVHNADCVVPNRRAALNAAKDQAGIPRSQQPVDQWTVGPSSQRNVGSSDSLSSDKGTWGRYYQYDTPGGPRVVVEHYGDIPKASHTHAGQPKGNSWDMTSDSGISGTRTLETMIIYTILQSKGASDE